MDNDLFNKQIIKNKNNIFEVEGLEKGEYDKQADLYDKLISNALYNKIMWGNSPKNYSDFCLKGLNNSHNGTVADIGCGTLSFTYKAYAQYCKRDLFLCDLSLEMLKIGKTRIEGICDNRSALTFLRADALNLPFRNNTIQTVLNFGFFHIIENQAELIKEIARVLNPEGQLFISSLCTDRKISARYLNLLQKKGHVADPLHSSEVRSIVEENGIRITDYKITGGMIFITGVKKRNKID